MADRGPAAADAIDGLILAGGRSLRMRTAALPDVDKGLRPWRRRPLVVWVLDYMRAQGVEKIWISANRNLDDYAAYGPVVRDAAERPDGGPLAGVLAGLQQLQQARAPWLFVLPVDVLHWPPGLLARLRAVARPDRPAFARTPDGPHPLCMVVHHSQRGGLQAFLDSGQRRVQDWLRGCQAQVVDFPGDDCLVNLNTPQDWARWQPGPH